MRVFGLPWSFHPLAKYPPLDLAPEARDRLRALQLWADTGDVALVGRTFAISRATLYRWRAQFNPAQPQSLTARSRRPHHVRRPQWPPGLVAAVRRLRRTYPRWGKDKLVVLLRHERWQVSTSTVGRILTHLRAQGQLVEPPRRPVSGRKRRRARTYAIRKPREYQPTQPGDLVELDTLDVRPVPGITLKHFTARDVISRWDVLQARERATATTAADFLELVRARMPFPIRACQVDGGAEFFAQFETACQRAGIRLFVLPPKSPKLNGAVERAHRTHTEEFYELIDCPWHLAPLTVALRRWETTYNTVRPHQALGYRTPLQFLIERGIVPAGHPRPSHMS
jgi:putative transposase